nr:hypothetical protein [Geminocystis herdmanii]
MKTALNQAIKQGLNLAIFNSCDGIGLAQELSKLNIPQVIVMRENGMTSYELNEYFSLIHI